MCEVKKLNPRTKDVVGEVYNKFTIIENLPSKKLGNYYYKRVIVRCECGNEKEMDYKAIKKGKIKSCGCLSTDRLIDITKENTYNYWTILSEVSPYISKDGSKMRKVLAECVCGKQSEVVLSTLRTGNSKSCGCMRPSVKGIKYSKRIKIDSLIPKINIDKINEKDLGNWTVLEEISAKRNEKLEIVRIVKVQCGCGYIKETKLNNIYDSKQCWTCAMDEIRNKVSDKDRKIIRKLYSVYNSMKSRCNNILDKSYKNYGGRGIIIEESFNTFNKFYKWILEQEYTIDCKLEVDRENNNGNYSIENCRLVSKKENSRNMRTNVVNWEVVEKIRVGEYSSLSTKELATLLNCNVATISSIKNFKTWKSE